MSDLRKAAEQALKYFEDAYGVDVIEFEIKEALRQALSEPEQVLTARTVITGREWVEITKGECDELFRAASNHIEYAYAIEAKLKLKNSLPSTTKGEEHMTTEEIIELAEKAGAEWSDFGRIQFEKEDDLAKFVDLILERSKNV